MSGTTFAIIKKIAASIGVVVRHGETKNSLLKRIATAIGADGEVGTTNDISDRIAAIIGSSVHSGRNIVVANNSGNCTISTHTGALKIAPAVTVYDDSIIPQTATNVVINAPADLTAIIINTSALQLLQVEGPIANLTTVSISPIAAETAPIGTMSVANAALSQVSVDGIIEACVTGGQFDGTLSIAGGTSAAPSLAGIANLATLTLRGWTFSTN